MSAGAVIAWGLRNRGQSISDGNAAETRFSSAMRVSHCARVAALSTVVLGSNLTERSTRSGGA